MIRVERPDEPDSFDDECRQPGNAWLTANPVGDPPNRWRHFVMDLCQGFQNRCGYSAMWDLNGTVDHYLSQDNRRDLAYEWSNFRYVAGWLNSSKQNVDQAVLDPFFVNDDWFEIALPSLVMSLTASVPARYRAVAEFTLTRLHLADDDKIYAQREIYYSNFIASRLTLTNLEQMAPLIATAVRRERVLTRLGTQSPISIGEAATLCETTHDQARTLLGNWVRAEHLQRQGHGRGVRYALA